MTTASATVKEIEGYDIVVTKVESHYLEFVVYDVVGTDAKGKRLYNRDGYKSSPDPVEDHEKAQEFINGSIKWDGCVNFSIEDEPVHFCSVQDAEEFGRIIPAVYALGKELISNWEGDY